MHTWKKWYIISESMNQIKQNINMNVNILVPIYMYWSSLLVHILSNYSIMIKWNLKSKNCLKKASYNSNSWTSGIKNVYVCGLFCWHLPGRIVWKGTPNKGAVSSFWGLLSRPSTEPTLAVLLSMLILLILRDAPVSRSFTLRLGSVWTKGAVENNYQCAFSF